jgi:hypothetical protein
MLGNGQKLGDNNSAKQIYVAGCYLLNDGNAGAPAGGTGMLILGSDQVRVVDTDIGGFSQAIAIQPGPHGQNAVHLSFTNLGVYAGSAAPDSPAVAGTALTVQPQSSSQTIGSVTFTNCRFDPGESDTFTSTLGSGITIDNKGSIIDTVRFVSCISTRWSGPGLTITYTGGAGKLQNIEVLGGMYAGNNLGGGSQPYGILATGAVSGVRIVGVSCVGHYRDMTNSGSSESPTQQIGISVDGGATDVTIDSCDLRLNSQNGASIKGESGAVTTNVFIRDCDASGYSAYSAAIAVGGAANITNLQITNCAGYNDQSVELDTTVPASGLTFYGYTYGYYGPTVFYVSGGTAVSVSVGTNMGVIPTLLASGAFTVGPQQGAAVNYNMLAAKPSFLLVGT